METLGSCSKDVQSQDIAQLCVLHTPCILKKTSFVLSEINETIISKETVFEGSIKRVVRRKGAMKESSCLRLMRGALSRWEQECLASLHLHPFTGLLVWMACTNRRRQAFIFCGQTTSWTTSRGTGVEDHGPLLLLPAAEELFHTCRYSVNGLWRPRQVKQLMEHVLADVRLDKLFHWWHPPSPPPWAAHPISAASLFARPGNNILLCNTVMHAG